MLKNAVKSVDDSTVLHISRCTWLQYRLQLLLLLLVMVVSNGGLMLQ